MSSSRAKANHSLYLANILLGGWEQALMARDIPAVTLVQAYLPAVRQHLLAAYGWFLLEVCDLEDAAGGVLPLGCRDLPAIPEGKALPGEILELRRLECEGWMNAMLAPPAGHDARPRSAGNLATAQYDAGFDLESARDWHANLEDLIGRMRNSLEES